MSLPFSIVPLSLRAALVSFEPVLSEAVHSKVMALYHSLEAQDFPGFIEAVPAFASLAVYYDTEILSRGQVSAFAAVKKILEDRISLTAPAEESPRPLIEIPVRYGDEWGPDLAYVAQMNGIGIRQAIELHTSMIYRVYMLGFMPGFAYMGITHEKLQVNRKASPQLQIPAGSVALAGRQTGIYPSVSPGGWQIIGRTETVVFDDQKNPPNLFFPGDRVRFVSV